MLKRHNPIKKPLIFILTGYLAVAGGDFLWAQTPKADGISAPTDAATNEVLAKKLRNPIANLISVPLQTNFDFGGGPHDNGFMQTTNLEPVIPIMLSKDWKLVSRSTIPFIVQRNIVPGTTQVGFSDSVERLLLSPAKKDAMGNNWGIGPAFLLPTETNSHLGADKWGAGPALAFVNQTGPWTTQLQAYQLLSFGGSGSQAVDYITIQPSVSYTMKTSTTFTLSAESVYNWRSKQYTAPVAATVNQVYKIGGQSMSTTVGVRYFAARPAGAPEWGLRLTMTFIFPQTR